MAPGECVHAQETLPARDDRPRGPDPLILIRPGKSRERGGGWDCSGPGRGENEVAVRCCGKVSM